MKPTARTPGIWRLSVFWSAASLCLLVCGATQAAVLYDSNGFEQPTYSVGPLIGQDGWGGQGTPQGDDPEVQSSVFYDGSQAGAALRLSTNKTSMVAWRGFGPSAGLVNVQTAIRVEDMGTGDSYLDAFYVYQTHYQTGNRATILFFQEDGDVTVYDGFTERMVGSWEDDQWYLIHFTFDVPNQTFDLSIGGVLVADDYAFLNSATALDGVAYQEYGGLQNGGWYWDDLEVNDNAVPEPQSGVLLGMAALALIATRRSKR